MYGGKLTLDQRISEYPFNLSVYHTPLHYFNPILSQMLLQVFDYVQQTWVRRAAR